MAKIQISITNYDGNEYIFFPACAYNGNRFRCLKKNYPPAFTNEEARIDMPITITDVPRLNQDGSGCVEVTTGDVSVPCMGMFSQERKEGMLIFTIQQMNGKNLGLSYENGVFSICNPENRKRIYVFPEMKLKENPEYIADKADESGEEPEYRVLKFPCTDIQEFYSVFFKNRKIMGMDASRPDNISEKEQWEIQKQKLNAVNYDPVWGYNLVASQARNPFGWCNGGIFSYAMMKLGGVKEWNRAVQSLKYIYSLQNETGFFPCNVFRDGSSFGDGFGLPGTENRIMIRRVGDVLYYTFKSFDVFEEKNIQIPEELKCGVRRLADAVAGLWKKYGQLGQIIDYLTGEMIIGGSTAGGIVPAGLARASVFFENQEYLRIAEEIAEQYYTRDVSKGYTVGGPGEVLQCPDSESAFGLLESMVVLYEVTNEKKWLAYAEHMANFCSSWVVSYNYKFPDNSECHRLGIKTTGTVFANVQNKHSAPGICTMSGNSIYKLYQFTGNSLYLELILDIKNAISQFLSTEERPVYSYSLDKEFNKTADKLMAGQMCERVNMSDWETKVCVGVIYNLSCWCELSNLLTIAELPNELFEKQGE